jgi:hypothetical protein
VKSSTQIILNAQDARRMSMTSYQETSFRTREVTETLCYSPELSTVNYPPVMSRKRNFHEEKNWVDYTTEHGGYRKEYKSQTTHNIIQVTIFPHRALV